MISKNKKYIIPFLLSLSLFISACFSFTPVSAAIALTPTAQAANTTDQAGSEVESQGLVTCTIGECTFCDLLKLIERIFYWLLSIAFVVAVLFVIISGFLYITSIGDSSMMGLAKEALKYSIIGFIICLVSWLSIHLVYTLLGYKGSNWWEIQCDNGSSTAQVDNTKTVTNIYANELPPDNIGGRNNPIALPDLTASGLKDVPENKYFFIHGIGGQPIEQAANQMAKIVQAAKDQGKIVYAVMPKKNLLTGEIEGSRLINLIYYLGANPAETQKNIEGLLAQLYSDLPSTELPLVVTKLGQNLPNFNNIWPDINLAKGGLATVTPSGVYYQENKVLPEQDVSKPNDSYFTINLNYDANKDKYSVNLDNPITFQFPEGVSKKAAEEAAAQVAKVVALSAKNSFYQNEDQWNALANNLVKYTNLPKQAQSSNSDEEEEEEEENTSSGTTEQSYSPGSFPSGILQYTTSNQDTEEIGKLTKDVQDIVDYVFEHEFGRNENTNENVISQESGSIRSGTSSTKTRTKTPVPTLPGLVETSPGDTGEDIYGNLPPTPSSSSGDTGDIVSPKKPGGSGSTGNPPSTGNANVPSSGTSSATSSSWSTMSPEYPSTSDINVSRVANVSDLKGRVSTDRILSLEEREEIRKEIMDIQKEMSDTTGVNYNIPPDVMMCIFDKESTFDPGAISDTGCSGLGQMSMGAAKTATEKLKKVAPEHFKALSDKVEKDFGVDLEKTMTKSGGNDKKREILRSDPNLNAALAYIHLTEKGVVGRGKPVGNNQELRNMVNGYGPGDSDYAGSIMRCLQNNNWRNISANTQKAIDKRLGSSQ